MEEKCEYCGGETGMACSRCPRIICYDCAKCGNDNEPICHECKKKEVVK